MEKSRGKKPIFVPLPREHGAWGILGGTYLSVMAFSGQFALSQFLFFLAIIFLYFARQPLLHLLKRKQPQHNLKWFLTFLFPGIFLLIFSAIYSGYWLILPCSAFLVIFLLAEILLIQGRRQMTFLVQLLGTIGLTAIAPLQLLLLQKSFSWEIGFIWIINALFFTSGILFVRYQISIMSKKYLDNPEVRRYKIAIICYHFCLLIILFWISIYLDRYAGLIFAFTPILIRAAFILFARIRLPNLRLVGWMEIAQTALFGFLLSIIL